MKYIISESKLEKTITNYLDVLFDVDKRDICPTVTVEYKYENILNGYFGDKWKEPFRKWFIRNFDEQVKTVDN